MIRIQSTHRHWGQLFALVLAHFTVDMAGGLLPGILPVLRSRFDLSLGTGVLLLATMGIGSNLFQLPAGMLRKSARLPLLLQIGLLLVLPIFFFVFFPASTPLAVLLATVLVVGVGIAFVHPEGLRGTMAVAGVPETVSTSCFMVAGFGGFASGAFISASLVSGYGLAGLIWLLPLPLAAIGLIYFFRVRLAVDTPKESAAGAEIRHVWTFREIFFISVFMNAGSSTMQSLLPSYLNESGFALPFCGMSAMLFGFGSALGSLVFGQLARKYHPSKFILWAMGAGLPVVMLYFALAHFRTAALLAIPSGFLLSAGFPLLVVLARTAPGRLALGMRMATIVGGSWAVATALFLGVGQLADVIGLKMSMNFVWLFYLAALVVAIIAPRVRKRG